MTTSKSGRRKRRERPKTSQLDDREGEIFDRISDGETILSITTEFGISRWSFYDWVRRDPAREATFATARERSAEVEVERAQEILEEAAEDRELTAAQASIARSRAEHHWKLAARRSPEYRENNAPTVNIGLTLGSAHLEALKQFGRMESPQLPSSAPKQLAPVEVVEAEIIEGQEEDEEESEVLRAFNS